MLVVFIVAVLEATFSPLLPEALIAIILAYRKDLSWKVMSIVSAFGSACGAVLMYFLGAFFYASYGQAILHFLHGESVVEKAKILFDNNTFVAQLLASFTPLPDRVFSFLAGAFLVSLPVIFIATFLGRLVRAGIVAYLSFEYGDEAREYIKKHTSKVVYCFILFLGIYILYKAGYIL